MKFVASRLSEGNKIFPAEIHIEENGVKVRIPGFLSGDSRFIDYENISAVNINTPMIGFSTLTFFYHGNRATAHGFKKEEVKQIKEAIDKGKAKAKITTVNHNHHHTMSYTDVPPVPQQNFINPPAEPITEVVKPVQQATLSIDNEQGTNQKDNRVYNQQLENLIELALADGELTEKEKQILFKKAEAAGIDLDEFEMVLEAKISEKLSKQATQKENIQRCPGCGDTINGINRVCNSCGFVLTKQNRSNELDKSISDLEDTLVELKSHPKPNLYKTLKPIILIYFTAGIYILYKKLYKKEHIFSFNSGLDQIVAKSNKQIRTINNSYGENPKVKKLLLELTSEKNTILASYKRSKIIVATVSLLIVLTICLIGFLQPKPISEQVEQLIDKGNIAEAQEVINSLKNSDYRKEGLQKKITEYEAIKLMGNGKFDEALQKASLINSEYERNELIEKIVEEDIDFLISSKEFKKAKTKALLVNNEYERKNLTNKIANAEKFSN